MVFKLFLSIVEVKFRVFLLYNALRLNINLKHLFMFLSLKFKQGFISKFITKVNKNTNKIAISTLFNRLNYKFFNKKVFLSELKSIFFDLYMKKAVALLIKYFYYFKKLLFNKRKLVVSNSKKV
jgi:hypothetical protein